eukprot:2950143-Amphidinium_carterae.1
MVRHQKPFQTLITGLMVLDDEGRRCHGLDVIPCSCCAWSAFDDIVDDLLCSTSSWGARERIEPGFMLVSVPATGIVAGITAYRLELDLYTDPLATTVTCLLFLFGLYRAASTPPSLLEVLLSYCFVLAESCRLTLGDAVVTVGVLFVERLVRAMTLRIRDKSGRRIGLTPFL